ncbi:MAG: GNAT family N-acetyltransferase [Methanomassiliicoccales archaeon]
MSVSFREMKHEDIDFALSITSLERWFTEKRDIKLYIDLGSALVAFVDGKRVGLATAFPYKSLGWVGNVVVSAEMRNRGIGEKLVTELIDRMKKKGIKTVGLYAYDRSRSLYERLGFTFDATFFECTVDRVKGNVGRVKRTSLNQEILDFDLHFFPQDRSRLLQHLSGRKGAAVLSNRDDTGALNGYLIASPGEQAYGTEIVPFCGEASSFDSFLSAIEEMPRPFHLYVPEENLQLIANAGINITKVTRMHRGYLGAHSDMPPINKRVLSAGTPENG